MGEYLSQREDFLTRCGPSLQPAGDSEPVKRVWYEHLEFKPLINAGASAQRSTMDRQSVASAHYEPAPTLEPPGQLSADDRLEVLYYLLLQDRISDGFAGLPIDATALARPCLMPTPKHGCLPAETRWLSRCRAKDFNTQWKQRFVVFWTAREKPAPQQAAGELIQIIIARQLEANNKARKHSTSAS